MVGSVDTWYHGRNKLMLWRHLFNRIYRFTFYLKFKLIKTHLGGHSVKTL